MCLATSNKLVARAIGCPKTHFFHELMIFWSAKNWCKDTFSIFHSLSPVIFATATVVVFVLLRNSSFNFHCYTQREATPTQKSSRKWLCDLSQLLAWKITKGIHLCKPASLNRPIHTCISCHVYFCEQSQEISLSRVVNIRYLLIDILWGAQWLLRNPSLFLF